jgi:hypothetical protein
LEKQRTSFYWRGATTEKASAAGLLVTIAFGERGVNGICDFFYEKG